MKYKTYYFNPPESDEPEMVVIATEEQTLIRRGQFQKLYRRCESKGWSIQEIKQKEKQYAKKEQHPQTGELVG
jgi:hypothetical protein|tara:strand:+ start:3736 stop:3954 length:219 start_codon:yes stop_codon:yes gene_type:complete